MSHGSCLGYVVEHASPLVAASTTSKKRIANARVNNGTGIACENLCWIALILHVVEVLGDITCCYANAPSLGNQGGDAMMPHPMRVWHK